MDRQLFAKRVAQLREAYDWSQADLADRVGVVRQQVWHWENGSRGITGKTLERLCEVLGVTLAEFWDPDYMPGKQEGLPLGEAQPALGRAIGALPTDIRNDKRAVSCPRCRIIGIGEKASYCPDCGFPLYNFCSSNEQHINDPAARYCEQCGAPTYWSMTDDELEGAGVPPLRTRQGDSSSHSTPLASKRP